MIEEPGSFHVLGGQISFWVQQQIPRLTSLCNKPQKEKGNASHLSNAIPSCSNRVYLLCCPACWLCLLSLWLCGATSAEWGWNFKLSKASNDVGRGYQIQIWVVHRISEAGLCGCVGILGSGGILDRFQTHHASASSLLWKLRQYNKNTCTTHGNSR